MRTHSGRAAPPERPAGVAADRQAGDDFDQLPRQVEDHWVVGLEDQVAWAGSVQNRLEVVAGGGQPGVEQGPAHRAEVFRVGHRPASPVIEEVEEPFADVKDGLRLQAGDGDGITNRRSIDGPTGYPGGRRIGLLDPEGQGGHRDAPRGDADAFSAATGGRSSTSASSKTIGADRPVPVSRERFQAIPRRRISSGSVGPTLTDTLLIGYRGTVTLPGRSRSGSAAEDQGLSGRGRRVALAAARRVRGVDSFPLIVNLLGVGRGGRPPGEQPAGDGNVDIRILTSNYRLFILLPGKRTFAILLTGSNIPEGEAGAV